jgi:hypothetical protein
VATFPQPQNLSLPKCTVFLSSSPANRVELSKIKFLANRSEVKNISRFAKVAKSFKIEYFVDFYRLGKKPVTGF